MRVQLEPRQASQALSFCRWRYARTRNLVCSRATDFRRSISATLARNSKSSCEAEGFTSSDVPARAELALIGLSVLGASGVRPRSFLGRVADLTGTRVSAEAALAGRDTLNRSAGRQAMWPG